MLQGLERASRMPDMPIRLHLFLVVAAGIVALLAGFMLGMDYYTTYRATLPALLQYKEVGFILFGMVPAALANYLMTRMLQYLVIARCPECGGRTRYRAMHRERNVFGVKEKVPITYHCQVCGHVHRTRVGIADHNPF